MWTIKQCLRPIDSDSRVQRRQRGIQAGGIEPGKY